MDIEIVGTITQSDLGMGTWTLVSEGNITYEIMQPVDSALLKEGLRVKARGKLRPDVMTMAMVGEVVQVSSFDILNNV
jgi:predicted transcriptional regulator